MTSIGERFLFWFTTVYLERSISAKLSTTMSTSPFFSSSFFFSFFFFCLFCSCDAWSPVDVSFDQIRGGTKASTTIYKISVVRHQQERFVTFVTTRDRVSRPVPRQKSYRTSRMRNDKLARFPRALDFRDFFFIERSNEINTSIREISLFRHLSSV